MERVESIGALTEPLKHRTLRRRSLITATSLIVACGAPFTAIARAQAQEDYEQPAPQEGRTTFKFGEDVPEHFQEQIRTTSASALEWFSNQGVYISGADIFAYMDPNTTVDKYFERSPQIHPNQHQAIRADRIRDTAFTGFNHDLFINASSLGWLYASPIIGGPPKEGRDHTIAHELLHVFQREVGAYDQEPTAWLNEGWAHYLAALFLEDTNIYQYDRIRKGHISEASKMREQLQTLESYQTFRVAGSTYADEFSLAFLAVEYLVKDLPDKGIPALADYWRKIGQGFSKQSAFEEAFGKRQEVFYREFEPYRQQGFK